MSVILSPIILCETVEEGNVASLNAISEALQKGKADEVKTLVTEALDEKVDAKKVLEEGLIAGMDIIGGRFKRNEIYIPEVLIVIPPISRMSVRLFR